MNINTLKLFEFCGKHKITFTYSVKKTGKNTVEYNPNEKEVSVQIHDLDDEQFPKLINDMLTKLENIFN